MALGNPSGVVLREIPVEDVETASVPRVRHQITAHLAALEVAHEVVETTALLASELLTNAITHGAAPIRCVATVARRGQGHVIRVEVWDASEAAPVLREQILEAESGRGLHLVEKFSSRWGWGPTAHGKSIYFEIETGHAQ